MKHSSMTTASLTALLALSVSTASHAFTPSQQMQGGIQQEREGTVSTSIEEAPAPRETGGPTPGGTVPGGGTPGPVSITAGQGDHVISHTPEYYPPSTGGPLYPPNPSSNPYEGRTYLFRHKQKTGGVHPAPGSTHEGTAGFEGSTPKGTSTTLAK